MPGFELLSLYTLPVFLVLTNEVQRPDRHFGLSPVDTRGSYLSLIQRGKNGYPTPGCSAFAIVENICVASTATASTTFLTLLLISDSSSFETSEAMNFIFFK